MQITVTVPDELVREAEARGLSVEAYAEEVLARIARTEAFHHDDPEARRKAVENMLGFAEKHGLRLAPGERITDLIHEARKYK